MSDNPIETSGTLPGSNEPESTEFLRWSSDAVSGVLAAETERRRGLENKSAQIIAAVAAVVLWSISSIESSPSAPWEWCAWVGAYGGTLLTGGVAGYLAFTALRVGDLYRPNSDAFTNADNLKVPMSERQRAIRDHLLRTLERASAESDSRAETVIKAERWAMACIVLGAVSALLARIAVAFAPGGHHG
ncbi:MAG: hypothetical protein L6R43_04585 [Planctomycetes bacterium]|nr:hypothetical protein [Planctomycetota bacterium]